MSELLDIVDENDHVVSQADRAEVHRTGLKFRLVYIYFYTPSGEIILQRRSMTKKSYPGCFTTTVSGHVQSGLTYEQAAIQEAYEETGIEINPQHLISLGVEYLESTERPDYVTNAMRGMYGYLYDGSVSELKVEEGEGGGFVLMSATELRQAITEHPEGFARFVTSEVGGRMLDKIESLLP